MALRQLSPLYGVQVEHYDVYRRRQEASAEDLLVALKALGAPVESMKDGVPPWIGAGLSGNDAWIPLRLFGTGNRLTWESGCPQRRLLRQVCLLELEKGIGGRDRFDSTLYRRGFLQFRGRS